MNTLIASQRTDKVLAILEALGSENPVAHLEAISVINPTADKPYHNAQHCITVALYASEGSQWLGYTDHYKLEIVLAALYHDYNHVSPDDNISRPLAVAGAREHVARIERNKDVVFVDNICHFIEEARYAKRRKVPERYQSRIVYDSDHMQILEPDFELFLEGLNKETGRSVSLENYVIDLRKRRLFTRWGKEYALVKVLKPERFFRV